MVRSAFYSGRNTSRRVPMQMRARFALPSTARGRGFGTGNSRARYGIRSRRTNARGRYMGRRLNR